MVIDTRFYLCTYNCVRKKRDFIRRPSGLMAVYLFTCRIEEVEEKNEIGRIFTPFREFKGMGRIRHIHIHMKG